MITRKKAIIVISGKLQDLVLPILRNHEALVQIHCNSEIKKVWSKNKTPIVKEQDLLKVCDRYEGNIFVFDTDAQNISENVSQIEVTEEITKFCYNFQIEPGEFKVKNTANNSAFGCIFCDIIKHPGMSTYTHNLNCKLVDSIIYESQNFVVIPGLGPLAPGYLMIMAKEHYLSLAQIPKELLPEYHEIEKDIEDILFKMYHKKVGFYEHGTGPNGAVGLKSLVHMHVHVMLDNELKDEYKNMLSMHKISNLDSVKDISYFWYKWGTDGDEWVTDDPEVYIQRQVHRQIYAEEHNFAKNQFNWRKTSFDELTKTNVWQLYEFLKKTDNPRIKARTNDFVKAAKARFEE